MCPDTSSFDEEFYLTCWWDVKEAVRAGHFVSGFQHWFSYGRAEGRCWKELGKEQMQGSRLPSFMEFKVRPESLVNFPCFDYRHRGFSVKTFMQDDELRDRLREEVSRIERPNVIEIGVFGGANILHLADLTVARGARITGIDPWEKATAQNGTEVASGLSEVQAYFFQLRKNLELVVECLSYDRISLIQEFSDQAAGQIENDSADFIYIDGDHSYGGVSKDLELYWPKLKKGQYLWGDDYDWPEVKEAADQFSSSKSVYLSTWKTQYILKKSS